ncbi:MAG: substrate-binding domain-containing protein [Candidatus Altiarchaeota archaeon]|nr:substrate-binding domain-containing protein [Candidatus Altiarchaeota archaeon]
MKKLMKNNKGMSEVVAVLVLIAVVIVGAVGAGVIMTTFSNQVADDTSAAGIGKDAAAELLIAGSTTVQPLSECLGKMYMEEHKGVRVTVQGGGSGAGIAAAGMNIVDIGSASKEVPQSDLEKYPKMQTHKVGGSAVVAIVSDTCPTGYADISVTKEELADLYENGPTGAVWAASTFSSAGDVDVVYQRAEASGTEETFAQYITAKAKSDLDDWDAGGDDATAVGNAGVLAGVQGATCAVGFVDFGYADGADDIVILEVDGKEATSTNILTELKNQDGATFPTKLTRPLNYLTNGDPSTVEDAFLTFARSPGAQECFDETGYFAVYEFA